MIPILSTFFLSHLYIALSNLKNFSLTLCICICVYYAFATRLAQHIPSYSTLVCLTFVSGIIFMVQLYVVLATPTFSVTCIGMASQSTQPPATNPAPQELTNNDLALLLETLNPVASKCHNLGVHLGLSSSQLHALDHDYRRCEDQLREIISERLRQESPLTWHDIARALRAVSENRLASEIENKYIHHLPPPASVAPQANTASIADIITSIVTAHTQPTQTHSSPSHATNPPLTNQFLPHPSWQPHMPIPHPAHHPPMRPPQYLPHYPPQLYSLPGLYGIPHLTAHPLSVQPHASDRPSLAEWGTPYPLPHHTSLHQISYSNSPNVPYHTIPRISLPTTNRYSPQEEAFGTGCNSPSLISDSEPQLIHTQTHRLSGSSSSESGCPPTKRPYLETTLEPYSQSHTQISSCGSGSIEHVSPMTMYKGKSRHTGEWSVSDTYLHQSGRQAPGREHYQSQEGPTTAGLHTTHKQSQNSSSGSGSTEVKSPMDVFIDYVRSTYRQSAIEKNLNVIKWPPTPCEVFIKLAIIDRSTKFTKSEVDGYTRAMVEDGNIDVILKKKDCSRDFDDIARGLPQTDSSRNVIVVEGAPGVGKSTFAWEFCRRWERGEIVQQYQLVLLLRLRDDRISKAKSLEDMIYHPRQDICQGVLHELLGNDGVNTLIILEGFDELPDEQRKLSSIFGQLILGKLLLHVTILVTSRPWATSAVMRKIGHRVFQHIEVLGFTEKNIERYVTSVFTGKEVGAHSAEESPDEVSEEAKKNIDDVMKYLDTYPQIKACMYIPLNAAIVVNIYQESKQGKCILPKTLTELYYALTQVLLVRYLYGHPVYSQREWNIDSFENDLPDEVYTQLLSISNKAYDGISRKWGESVQLIFSDLPAGFETLGFMQSVSQLYVKHGQRLSHNFLHLTVQEFLAALYIQTAMTPAEQLEHFKRHKEGRLKVVLRFLAGLTKLKTVTHEQLRGLLGEPHTEQSDECQTQYCNPMKADVCVSAHHTNWLFEAQNPDLVQSLLHNHTAAFTFTRDMLQLEYYSVGYCIAYSHSNWLLIFEDDADVEKLSMIVSGVQAGNIHHSTRLALKTSKHNFMSNEKLNFLWKGFSSCIEELYLEVPKSLDLSNLSSLRILVLTMDIISSISVLSVHCLESLTIIGTSKNGVSIKSVKAIGKFLLSSSSLKELCVKESISLKPMEEIVKGVCDNTALPLRRLEICGEVFETRCSLSTTASRSLGQFITRSTTLQYLRICNVDISGQGLIALIAAIHNCSSLQETKIEQLEVEFDDKCSDVSTEEVRASLAQLINDHPHMMDVEESLRDLSATEENYIKVLVNVIAISYDCNPTQLNISDTGAVALAQALHHNSTLYWLNLPNNSIGDAGAVALAQPLHHNSTLNVLDLSNNSISDAGAVALAKALHHNSTLKQLSLSNNSISDAGAAALAQALHHNSTLKVLDLSNNSISDAGAVALAQALHHNSTLEELYLSNNSISDAGAAALAQTLHHNSTLEELLLYGNDGIGKEGTHQLVQALTVNTSINTYIYDGLGLPKRCEKYATQCTQYDTVKNRMYFN